MEATVRWNTATRRYHLWDWLCYRIGSWKQPVGAILSTLIGIWILLAVIIPATGREVIDRMVPVPSGADIVMNQREVVNSAWDLPKAQTMTAWHTFVAPPALLERILQLLSDTYVRAAIENEQRVRECHAQTAPI